MKVSLLWEVLRRKDREDYDLIGIYTSEEKLNEMVDHFSDEFVKSNLMVEEWELDGGTKITGWWKPYTRKERELADTRSK